MFTLEDHGTIVLVRPLTADVRDWLLENVAEESQWFGGALVVEHRYVEGLYLGLVSEGFAAQ
jgi:hypothetical protein